MVSPKVSRAQARAARGGAAAAGPKADPTAAAEATAVPPAPPPGLEFVHVRRKGEDHHLPPLGLEAQELVQAMLASAAPLCGGPGHLVVGLAMASSRRPSVGPDDAPAKVPFRLAPGSSASAAAGCMHPGPIFHAGDMMDFKDPPVAETGRWPGTWAGAGPAKVPIDPAVDGLCLAEDHPPWGMAVPSCAQASPAPWGAEAPYLSGSECKWHRSANTVGIVSADGHIFTKTAGNRKVVMSSRGLPMELSSICMVFDESLRRGGTHRYHYQILDGELGVADGAGFVFDSQVRRNNIQRMRSVFLNQRGDVCLRDRGHVSRLGAQLPRLAVGMWLVLQIDLDTLYLQFHIFSPDGYLVGVADVSLDGLFDTSKACESLHSGFFCAVVTRDISVALA